MVRCCRKLCDSRDMGKLNSEQFALCMYLAQKAAVEGIPVPDTLAPNMVPPSMRVQVRTNAYKINVK